jgi:hypothetical protein
MNEMNYREVFITAVLVSGLAVTLFAHNPASNLPLEADAAQTLVVQKAG